MADLALYRIGLGPELAPMYVVAETVDIAIAYACEMAEVGAEAVTGTNVVAVPVVIAAVSSG